MSTTINRDEWLAALTEAGVHSMVDDQDAVTVNEFAAMFGKPLGTARSQLISLEKAGKAIRTTKREKSAYGRWIWYVAYKLK